MNNFKRVKKLLYGGLSSLLTTPKPTISSVTQPWYLQINANSPLTLLLLPLQDYTKLINLFNIGSTTPTSKSTTSTGILSKLNISKEQLGSIAGLGLDMMNSMMFNDTVDAQSFDTAMLAINGIGDIVGLVNPMFGAAVKGLGFAVKGINSLGGKKSQDFSADLATIEEVGSSYGGSVAGIQDADNKAGKKYGLFSGRARRRANNLINKMRPQLNIMTNIANEASDMRSITANMSDINHLAYAFDMAGGYDQRFTRAAKHGGNLTRIKKINFHKQGGNIKGVINFAEEFIPEIVDLPEMFKDGGKIEEFIPEIVEIFKDGGPVKKPTFDEWFSSIPEKYKGKSYDYKLAYNVLPTDQLLNHAKNPEKYHLLSVSGQIDEHERIPFLKLGKVEENPEILPEFDAYNNDSTLSDFRNKYEILYIDDRYYYVPRKFKDGGKVETEESSQKNLIPEGALHARKHHMENDDNITKKGIPVIDNEGELQAEIELNEIIFTLEVTKKLEELQKKYYETNDEQYAIEAGKLLVQEILYNTDDRTDLIKSCKEGGVL